jgi:MoaA/NifB/PqqE/SkfB family radical SAM enzyme
MDYPRYVSGPQELKMEVTEACPLKCWHCSVNAGDFKKRNIDYGVASSLIEEFAELGGKALILTGGEPLCNPSLLQIAHAAKTTHLRVFLYTTGLTISNGRIQAAAEKLQEIAELIDVFVFCLHGATAHIHDNITRVLGSFNATLKAIRYVLYLRKQVIVHHVPLRLNAGELLPLCALLENYGITSLKLLRFVPQGRGETNRSRLELDSGGVYHLTNEIAIAWERFRSLSIDLGTPYAPLGSTRNGSCKAGWGTLSVNASLECSPCDGFKTILGGAFNEPLSSRSLRKVWYESHLLWAIRKARNEAVQANCQGCLAQKSLANGRLCGTSEDPLFTLAKKSTLNAALASV